MMESLKEIAQRLAYGYWKRDQWNLEYFDSVGFAEALISAYKAELLHEAGEPVFVVFDGPPGPESGRFIEVETKDRFSVMAGDWENHIPDYWRLGPFFTSDQVAAAIIKATKPLEGEIERLKTVPMKYRRMAFNAQLQDENNELRAQLTAAQEEIERLKATPPDKREDLRCVISDLCHQVRERDAQLAKAEQRVAEWQPIETAPKETEIFIGRFIDGKFRFGRSELFYEHANEFAGETWSGWLWSIDNCNESIADCPTHWMPLPKAPTGASS